MHQCAHHHGNIAGCAQNQTHRRHSDSRKKQRKEALEKAKTEGLILSNPAAGCKLPPKKKKEMQVLTGEEMQRFLIQAKEDGFYEMMLLELATGMRRGEICALHGTI